MEHCELRHYIQLAINVYKLKQWIKRHYLIISKYKINSCELYNRLENYKKNT